MKTDKSQIIEIGFEVKTQDAWDFLEKMLDLLAMSKYEVSYYIEPQPKPPWASLEDLECNCEGK